MADDSPIAGTWKLLHRGDPCILCQKPVAEQSPSGCPVTPEQIWSRIGDLSNAAFEAWEEHGFGEADAVVARSLEEEVRRLTRLHKVLTEDMAPAGGQS